jgi:hypothetical protein
MPLLPMVSSSIRWFPWGVAAFARAREERKPVLLSLTTSWSDACREMDDTTYASPDVVAAVNDQFVAVRVDAERRPDISERYTLGGWPTTAFLDADGRVLGGGTFVSADRMPAVLAQVRDAFGSREATTGTVARAPSEEDARECCESDLVARVFDSYDEEHGGFGLEPKFPLVAPIRLALQMWADTQDPRLETIVVTTLDSMGWGDLYDDVEGGFFRYAASRDWTRPHIEKLLDVNASLLGLYLEAATVLGVSRFADRAAGVLRFTQAFLSDPDGGWYSSRGAAIDRTLFSDANAAMVSATLRAAAVFDDEGLKEYALRSFERVLLAAYRPGAGVAHYHDGHARVRGLLADQVAMATAALDAHAATGNVVYEMMAEELAHYLVRTMGDERGGGFFDRAAVDEEEPLGLLREPLTPFVGNCEAARMLARLARTSGEADSAERARRTLASLAPLAHRQGPVAAHYLLALHDARRTT